MAGSISRNTCRWRCTRRVSGTTAPAREVRSRRRFRHRPGDLRPVRGGARGAVRDVAVGLRWRARRAERRGDGRVEAASRGASWRCRGILEFGPGTGRFAGTVLRELAARGALPESYLLLEVGADLRERQPARVRELAGVAAGRAQWLAALPARFEGVVFGNEVLDALPCERFMLRDGVPHRLGVGLGADGRFGWRERAPDGSARGRRRVRRDARGAPARRAARDAARRLHRRVPARDRPLDRGARRAADPRRGAARRLRPAAPPLLPPAARRPARCAATTATAPTTIRSSIPA